MRAASTLLAMPPVPTPPCPVRPIRAPARSVVAAHVRDQAGAARAGIAVVEPLDVGEQHQQVGVHEVGDQRSEPVVVTEADLLGGDRVVLVDHRYHAHREQPVEGALRVAVVRTSYDVLCREQDLPRSQPVPGERLGVAVHQQALPDAGGRLLGGQVARAAAQAHRPEPGRDRPGGDQHQLPARRATGRQRVHQPVQAGTVDAGSRTSGATGEGRGADLDDDPGRCGHGCAPVAGAGRAHLPSSRRSAPRRPCSSSAPAFMEGSQSKITACSPSPMTTSSPASAPASSRASSTPSRARRSAR